MKKSDNLLNGGYLEFLGTTLSRSASLRNAYADWHDKLASTPDSAIHRLKRRGEINE